MRSTGRFYFCGRLYVIADYQYFSTSSLVVSLGKALNGMPPSSCGRRVVGPSSLLVVVAQSDERHANRA